jgi:hypothetical protein
MDFLMIIRPIKKAGDTNKGIAAIKQSIIDPIFLAMDILFRQVNQTNSV